MERYWTETSSKSLRWDIFVLTILILAGGFLRYWNLDVPSLYVDEANTIFSAESFLKIGRDLFPSGIVNGRGELHTAIVALVFRFLGISEKTARIPSVFFGLLSIFMVYFLGRKVFNRKVGLLTAFFVAFSHFEIGWSRTARMYTLLQFLSLLILYIFLLGFERSSQWGKIHTATEGKRFSLTKVKRFLKRNQIAPLWILICGFLIWLNAFKVHLLGTLLLGGFFIYITIMAFILFVTETNVKRYINKYSIFTFGTLVIAVMGWVFVPYIQSKIHYFLSYTPPWAQGSSTAQGRFYLFDFLISPYRFPFAVFFFIGCVQVISRRKKLGWLLMSGFLFPLFCLTFVFTHRVPAYIFYVYPLFLMLAAYGFVNFLGSEAVVMMRDTQLKKRWIRSAVMVLYFLIFLIPPWFRISLHIPFFEDGITNLAVTPNEWREACHYVKERISEKDITITSLPVVAMYYKIQSDYDLNWTHLSQAKMEEFKNQNDRWADMYAGVSCIESLDELVQLMKVNQSGWLIVAKYHIEHALIIPEAFRHFIDSHLEEPFKTRNNTVWVYHW